MVGDLVTARAILDGVRDGRIDVGPLDAYWHMLIRKHRPGTDGGRPHSRFDRGRPDARLRRLGLCAGRGWLPG